jgi:hypothetical protein
MMPETTGRNQGSKAKWERGVGAGTREKAVAMLMTKLKRVQTATTKPDLKARVKTTTKPVIKGTDRKISLLYLRGQKAYPPPDVALMDLSK